MELEINVYNYLHESLITFIKSNFGKIFKFLEPEDFWRCNIRINNVGQMEKLLVFLCKNFVDSFEIHSKGILHDNLLIDIY